MKWPWQKGHTNTVRVVASPPAQLQPPIRILTYAERLAMNEGCEFCTKQEDTTLSLGYCSGRPKNLVCARCELFRITQSEIGRKHLLESETEAGVLRALVIKLGWKRRPIEEFKANPHGYDGWEKMVTESDIMTSSTKARAIINHRTFVADARERPYVCPGCAREGDLEP